MERPVGFHYFGVLVHSASSLLPCLQLVGLSGQSFLLTASDALLLDQPLPGNREVLQYFPLWDPFFCSLWFLISSLTLSAPALQSYVIHHTHMRQKFYFSKILFLPWLTIVLHRITKENLSFSPKEARACYNLSSMMCYPLFVSISKFICPKNTNWWRIRSNFVPLFLL